MFNNIINNIQNKINNIKEENKKYNQLIKTSSKFTGLQPIPSLSQQPNEAKINFITEFCPDINKEKSSLISKLIPTSETYLTANYAKEIITNTNYFLITTNKYLWLINEKKYGILPYEKITSCSIIKNNIMSKIINLNNILIEINGNEENINKFINILSNPKYRNNIIKEKTTYLCNITPIFQLINKINSGISIDNNKNIVFHSKTFNYKYKPEDIMNYELLLDNNVIMGKKQNTTNKITSMQNTCYSISIRITTSKNTFIIPILEPSTIGTKYTHQDSLYIKNIKFAKEIIYKLNELCLDNYYQ